MRVCGADIVAGCDIAALWDYGAVEGYTFREIQVQITQTQNAIVVVVVNCGANALAKIQVTWVA